MQVEASARNLQQDYESQVKIQAQSSDCLQTELENLKIQIANMSEQRSEMHLELMDFEAKYGQQEMELQRFCNDARRIKEEGRFYRESLDEVRHQINKHA